mmetsp:Transcript_80845/g.224966  ORF Transcript_80845/g.224966 Transcript_80845/m.224966 type:complete len:212 (-) Transcript_80845:27-662(-)
MEGTAFAAAVTASSNFVSFTEASITTKSAAGSPLGGSIEAVTTAAPSFGSDVVTCLAKIPAPVTETTASFIADWKVLESAVFAERAAQSMPVTVNEIDTIWASPDGMCALIRPSLRSSATRASSLVSVNASCSYSTLASATIFSASPRSRSTFALSSTFFKCWVCISAASRCFACNCSSSRGISLLSCASSSSSFGTSTATGADGTVAGRC